MIIRDGFYRSQSAKHYSATTSAASSPGGQQWLCADLAVKSEPSMESDFDAPVASASKGAWHYNLDASIRALRGQWLYECHAHNDVAHLRTVYIRLV
ncbi:hypothetical protein VTH82DRAFT_2595 [Thermothelomyces myriococcoides]